MQKKEKMIYRAALYIRLSKEDGDKPESNSISNQRALLYSFLKGKSDIQVCTEKIDDGYSGVDFKRPAMLGLLEEIKRGEINCVIVKDLSRFGRNYIETGKYIQQIFPFMGVRFIAINDNYDSINQGNPSDNILLPFRNLMNDSYCRDISIKVRSQIEIRQKRGDFVGSFPVFGYFKDKQNKSKLVADETAAAVIRDIFRLRIAGWNNKSIVSYLKAHGIPSPMEYKRLLQWSYSTPFKLKPQAEWSPAAVNRILKNEIYTGVMVQGKEKTLNYKVKKRIKLTDRERIRVDNTHEAIVSKEEFELVQKLMLRDTRTAPDKAEIYPLSGILCCGSCGCNMVRRKINSAGKSYAYYICSSNKNNKAVCSSHRIREDFIKGAVFSVLQSHTGSICGRAELLKIIEGLPVQEYEIQKRSRQLGRCRQELLRKEGLKQSVYEDYREGLLTEKDYMEMKKNYEAACRQLEGAIEALEEEIKDFVKHRNQHSKWIEKCRVEGNITELNRRLLAFTIDKIVVLHANAIKIHFKYQDEFTNIFKLPGEVWPYGEKKQKREPDGNAEGA